MAIFNSYVSLPEGTGMPCLLLGVPALVYNTEMKVYKTNHWECVILIFQRYVFWRYFMCIYVYVYIYIYVNTYI